MATQQPPLTPFHINQPVPDLAAIAAQKAAEAANPWHGININVNRIPPSALFDIFLTESIDASNQAVAIANMMANGALPKAQDGRPIQSSAATILIQTMLAIAQQKATLAHASATMAHAIASSELDLVSWFGPDGTRESGWAARYLAMMQEERTASINEGKPLSFVLSPE